MWGQVLTQPIRTLGRIADNSDALPPSPANVVFIDGDSPIDINNVNVNQVFEDPSEKIVDFSAISLWQIGEENVIEYTLPHGYEEAENDWIGVYKVRMAMEHLYWILYFIKVMVLGGL